VLLGFNPDSADDLRAYAELNAAKRKVAREYILNNETPDDVDTATGLDLLYIDDTVLEDYYFDNNFGDACILDVRFSSKTEAEAILEDFNLVANYNLGWGLYNPADNNDTPIEDVATEDFDDTNTTELTEEETFAYFADLYNYMNPNATEIADGTTFESYCADHSDIAVRSYQDMITGYEAASTNVTYAKYIFETLGLGEDDQRYSVQGQTIGDFYMLTFKVDQDPLTPYADLTQAEKDAVLEEVLREKLNDSNVASIIEDMYSDHEFEIFDPTLKLQSEYNFNEVYDNKGSKTLVAKFDDIEITADDLFTYMNDSIGSYYSIEIARRTELLNSTYYTDVYGDNFDYLNSNNEAMAEHRSALRTMKSQFSGDSFASYGFSSADYTWEEFLVLAFKGYSEATVIRDVYVLDALQPYLLTGKISYAQAVDYIENQVDNYFSLNVEELLFFVDYDFDFEEDTWTEIKDALDETDLNAYNVLKADLEDLIQAKIDDEYTFEDIVNEYQNGLIDDAENEWAQFKEFGFYIKTQNLSSSASLNYNNVMDSDNEDLLPTLQRIYASFNQLIDSSAEDVTEYYDDRVVETEDGIHYFYATKGTGFEKPTAIYDNTDGAKSVGSAGTTIAPNQDQIELYIEIRMAEATDTAALDADGEALQLPASVEEAIDAYYGELFGLYFGATNYSIIGAEYILDNNATFDLNHSDSIEFLENAIEVLYDVYFPEEFILE
jgi:hypothetical protein